MEKVRKCTHCDIEFEPTRPNHHFCSDRCRKREKDRRYRKRKRLEEKSDPTTFLRHRVPEPPEREGVPFPLTHRLPGSFEGGKKN